MTEELEEEEEEEEVGGRGIMFSEVVGPVRSRLG